MVVLIVIGVVGVGGLCLWFFLLRDQAKQYLPHQQPTQPPRTSAALPQRLPSGTFAVRLEKALGHTHHLRLALARDADPKRLDAAKIEHRAARAMEYQATLDLYKLVWQSAAPAARKRAIVSLRADANARGNPEYTDAVIADTIAYLEG